MKLINAAVVATIIGVSSEVSMAADYKQNPFTLTYDGAISANVKGMVNIHPVFVVLDHALCLDIFQLPRGVVDFSNQTKNSTVDAHGYAGLE